MDDGNFAANPRPNPSIEPCHNNHTAIGANPARNPNSNPNAGCCPAMAFLASLSSPARPHASAAAGSGKNPRLGYDPRLIHSAVDMPSLCEAMERDRYLEEKLAKEHVDDDDGDDGDDDGDEDYRLFSSKCKPGHFCFRNGARFGVVSSPVLASRVAFSGLLLFLLVVMMVLTWILTSSDVQHYAKPKASGFGHELLLHTQAMVSDCLQQSNASVVALSEYLSSLKVSNVSASFLEDQVRPALYLVFSALTKKTQVAFFSKSGLFLSYTLDSSGVSFVYTNTSFANSNTTSTALNVDDLMENHPAYKWYSQRVDGSSGLPYGEAVTINPFPYWAIEPVKSSLRGQYGVTSLDRSIGDEEVLLSFLHPVKGSVPEDPLGAISIGVSFAMLSDSFDWLDLQGGAIYLASMDGHLLAQTGRTAGLSPGNDTHDLPYAMDSDNTIVAEAASYLMPHLPYIATLKDADFTSMNVDLHGKGYIIESFPIHTTGPMLLCVVIVPYRSIWGWIERWRHTTLLAVLIALTACVGLVGFFFMLLLSKGVSNEMGLRASLIQQLERTKAAETKSSHKSLVFANMSHDLRTPLAAILGLIDLCLCDDSVCSELEINLLQMKSCATNLLGILNSILDMSKIEAGKLLLEESEFNLVKALEEVVDTFSVMGLKKGVEVALDLSDGSVEKLCHVIGDAGRVKQIMANLLSNGVKFTSSGGHVILRAWVKSIGDAVDSMKCRVNQSKERFRPWNQFFRSPSREKEVCKPPRGFSQHLVHETESVCIEFEVDDTGKGIPKERWKSVFENFVQVESSGPRSYDGTGLGLGIVRSLVRLMGGDICIIDKDEPGEPGSRFHFTLAFKCTKKSLALMHIPYNADQRPNPRPYSQEKHSSSLQSAFNVGNATSGFPSWKLNPCFQDFSFTSPPPNAAGVHVLLAMRGHGGRKVVKKWMERRGLHLQMIDRWGEFGTAMDRIKQDLLFSDHSFSTSERFDTISPENDSWEDHLSMRNTVTSHTGRARTSTDALLNGTRPSDSASSAFYECTAQKEEHLNANEVRAGLLLVVDISIDTVPLETLCSDIEDSLSDPEWPTTISSYRIVWLVNGNTPSSDIHYLKERPRICSLILHKPLYASRLQHVWELIQELSGSSVQSSCSKDLNHHVEAVKVYSTRQGSQQRVDLSRTNALYTSLSCMSTFREQMESRPSIIPIATKSEARTKVDRLEARTKAVPSQQSSEKGQATVGRSSEAALLPSSRRVGSHGHVLGGMRVLVAEDNRILQRLTMTQLTRLGASVVCVENGAEASRLVLEALYRSKASSSSSSSSFSPSPQAENGNIKPFDLVLMDCEMPILNGYEATKRIRSEEGRYGVKRTPVIALTAHAMAQDEKKCIEAGMDFYLTKPLVLDALLDIVSKVMCERERKGSSATD